eukprot:Platyproteum_vivax@DN8319_c0_g1_i1.p1
MNPSRVVLSSFVLFLQLTYVVGLVTIQEYPGCMQLGDDARYLVRLVNQYRLFQGLDTLTPTDEMHRGAYVHLENRNCEVESWERTNQCMLSDPLSWGGGENCARSLTSSSAAAAAAADEQPPKQFAGCCNNYEDCASKMGQLYADVGTSMGTVTGTVLRWQRSEYESASDSLESALLYLVQSWNANGEAYQLLSSPSATEIGAWVTSNYIIIYMGSGRTSGTNNLNKSANKSKSVVCEESRRSIGTLKEAVWNGKCTLEEPTWYAQAVVQQVNDLRSLSSMPLLKWVLPLTQEAVDHAYNLESPLCSLQPEFGNVVWECSRELGAWKSSPKCYPTGHSDTVGCCPTAEPTCTMKKAILLNPEWNGEIEEVISYAGSGADSLQSLVNMWIVDPVNRGIVYDPSWTSIGAYALPLSSTIMGPRLVAVWFGRSTKAEVPCFSGKENDDEDKKMIQENYNHNQGQEDNNNMFGDK